MRVLYDRTRLINRLRASIDRYRYARIQMAILVALTGCAGFLFSYLLLATGLSSMALRYSLAVGMAYFCFLLLLNIWLRTSVRDHVESAGDYLDIAEGTSELVPRSIRSANAGGECTASDDDSLVGTVADGASAADEFALPLIIVAGAVAVVVSMLGIVYAAPSLFAELLLDGALSAGLYRRLRKVERRNWLETAFRRTVWPFAFTGLVAFATGSILGGLYPDATSLGEVLQFANRRP